MPDDLRASLSERVDDRSARVVRRTALPAMLVILSALAASAGARAAYRPDAWRGRLYTCGSHPTVHIPADVAYAYEKDLTHATEGKVSFGRSTATVSFSGQYGTFTIERRKIGY